MLRKAIEYWKAEGKERHTIEERFISIKQWSYISLFLFFLGFLLYLDFFLYLDFLYLCLPLLGLHETKAWATGALEQELHCLLLWSQIPGRATQGKSSAFVTSLFTLLSNNYASQFLSSYSSLLFFYDLFPLFNTHLIPIQSLSRKMPA